MRRSDGRPGRFSSFVVATAVALGTMVGTATIAAAANPVNGTPATATTFTTIPYQGQSSSWYAADPATDAASQQVASACNAGAPINGPAWWRYDAAQTSTFVAHAADLKGGIAGYEPTGLAVLSADASTVLACGNETQDITTTGALTVAAGQSRLVVAYSRQATEFYSPTIGLFASSGVTPSNDEPATATPITSLPFTTTQDTTLATTSGGVGCYSKFGVGPDTWFTWTAERTDLVRFSATADYDVHVGVVPVVNGELGQYSCDEQFTAQAGTTYLISVWATSDDLKQTGTFTLSGAYLPPAPTLSVSVDANGTVNKKTGVVSVAGTVSCSGADSAPYAQGSLSQTVKRVVHTAPMTFTSGFSTCAGSTRWTATATSPGYKFTGGSAQVRVDANACNARGCTPVSVMRTVKLKVV